MKLSEKQLLLLSNFVYFSSSTKKDKPIGEIVGKLYDEEKKKFNLDNEKITGGITKEEGVKILQQIQDDKVFNHLITEQVIDTNIRGICIKDDRDIDNKEAAVIFRGTGGIAEAWMDNFRGLYMVETEQQQEAINFVRNQCKNYDVVITAGHSKGGNLAQCVAIINGDKINKCVSFDGQGFSKYFIENHKNEINKNAKKITSISSYRDPVNQLLTKVAGKDLYIKTDDSIKGFDNHKSTILINKKYFNDLGEIDKSCLVEPAKIMQKIHNISENLIQGFSKTSKKSAVCLIGPIASTCLSNDKKESMLNLFKEELSGIHNKKPLESINYDKYKLTAEQECLYEVVSLCCMHDDIITEMKNIDNKDLDRSQVDKKFLQIKEKTIDEMKKIKNILGEDSPYFKNVESQFNDILSKEKKEIDNIFNKNNTKKLSMKDIKNNIAEVKKQTQKKIKLNNKTLER